MAWFIIISGLIAPAIFWLGYFYYKDRYLPEPPLEAGISYILGFFAACLIF
jgi:RsiW-degrading membrane proteinase PrsW (M82 family)